MKSKPLTLHPDRLFPRDAASRDLARALYKEVKDLPIISPHGHTDPSWFSDNACFSHAVDLFIKPDHYVFRMLYSQGISLDELGIERRIASPLSCTDMRKVWRTFAEHYHLFRGTPTRLWFDTIFYEVFGFRDALDAGTADRYFDEINTALATESFKPRALFDHFNIEVITTTEAALDSLEHHKKIRQSEWHGRVLTAFRPDNITDPDCEDFVQNISELGDITGEDTLAWQGYLAALRQRRLFFKNMGATSTDHGHPSAKTADLSLGDCEKLFSKALTGELCAEETELFRGQMLTEMAGMSIDDGLVMQIHPCPHRNHNRLIFEVFGRDRGADFPGAVEYVNALKPLLNKYGNDKNLSVIIFSLDESSYSRELAPLASHYPALKLGPAWWFHDSPEGMRRFRQHMTETAGFYNTVGFNDDTRGFLSIPARHDVARRIDCGFLAEWVCDHRLREEEAHELAVDLSYNLAKKAYRL